MRKSFCLALLALLFVVALLASVAPANSQQYYHRTDAEKAAAARTYLDGHNLHGITVRAWRGRLTLGGALPAGDQLAALDRDLVTATGALSIHH